MLDGCRSLKCECDSDSRASCEYPLGLEFSSGVTVSYSGSVEVGELASVDESAGCPLREMTVWYCEDTAAGDGPSLWQTVGLLRVVSGEGREDV